MKHKAWTILVGAALALAVVAATALGATGSAASPRASKRALVAVRATGLGRILVDAHGHSLYLFEKDQHGRSACYGACAAYWPPLLTSAKPRPARGVHASLLGVSRRSDGKRQVTYAGHPLYTVVSDRRAGQTTGEGVNSFGAPWDVVGANGRAIEPPASSTGSSGGYAGL
jgi:predicted lipoprotein with Yx(FWY)xxD motif